MAHGSADTPGYESAGGVRVVRALPLYSKRLGMVGKADIVEFRETRRFRWITRGENGGSGTTTMFNCALKACVWRR